MTLNHAFLRDTELIIKRQGAVRVNHAWCHKLDAPIDLSIIEAPPKPSIAVVEVDLHSKYAELMTYSNGTILGDRQINGPAFVLDAGANTMHLSQQHEGWTEIVLPEFINWDVFCCDLSRYTLKVCLTSQLI